MVRCGVGRVRLRLALTLGLGTMVTMPTIEEFAAAIEAEISRACPKCSGKGRVAAAYQIGDTLVVPPGTLDAISSLGESSRIAPMLGMRVVEDPNIMPATCKDCEGSGLAAPEVCEGAQRCETCRGSGIRFRKRSLHERIDKTCFKCKDGIHTIHYCPIVLITADWLEEQGDPRAAALRGMRVAEHPSKLLSGLYGVEDGKWIGGYNMTLPDAARELLRRALSEITTACLGCERCGDQRVQIPAACPECLSPHCGFNLSMLGRYYVCAQCDHAWPVVYNVPCDGRGWHIKNAPARLASRGVLLT